MGKVAASVRPRFHPEVWPWFLRVLTPSSWFSQRNTADTEAPLQRASSACVRMLLHVWAGGGGARAGAGAGPAVGPAPGRLPFLRSAPGELPCRQFIVLGGGKAGFRIAGMLMFLLHVS